MKCIKPARISLCIFLVLSVLSLNGFASAMSAEDSIIKIEGMDALNPFKYFTDVKSGDWFYTDVAYIYENDLMNPTGDTEFCPNTAITCGTAATILYHSADALGAPNNNFTREQLATILYSYEQYTGKIPPNITMPPAFADENSISGYAKDSVNALAAQGVVYGRPGNIFDPLSIATRAEFAAMLHRLLNAVISPPGRVFNIDSETVKAARIQNGNTFQFIEYSDQTDIKKLTDYLNAFRFSYWIPDPPEPSGGWSYRVILDIGGESLSYYFSFFHLITDDSILVDGVWYYGSGHYFSKLADLFD